MKQGLKICVLALGLLCGACLGALAQPGATTTDVRQAYIEAKKRANDAYDSVVLPAALARDAAVSLAHVDRITAEKKADDTCSSWDAEVKKEAAHEEAPSSTFVEEQDDERDALFELPHEYCAAEVQQAHEAENAAVTKANTTYQAVQESARDARIAASDSRMDIWAKYISGQLDAASAIAKLHVLSQK